MWTIRTRMMTQSNHEDYRNTFHAAQKIYKTEGLYALYRGVIPSMWGLVNRYFSLNLNEIVFI
jgi:solute carrier family 25 folate transporter 32